MALRVDGSKQARWLDLVQRWQRSQLSVREFCERHHLSEASFYSWRRVLQQRGLIDPPTRAGQSETPAFVKVALPDPPAVGSAIELVVGQRVVRVRPGFDAAMLLELLRVLEEPAC
jgi:transposase-like protein